MSNAPPPRPDAAPSVTRRVRVPGRDGPATLYVTVTRYGDPPAPREVFLVLGAAGTDERGWAEALGRMISLALRSGTPVEAVVRTLAGIAGERSVTRPGGGMWHSAPAAVAEVLADVAREYGGAVGRPSGGG